MVSIWIPDRARDEMRPKFTCRLCDERFHTFEAMEAHCLRCAIDKEQEIYNASLDRQDLNSVPDPEWMAYNRHLMQQGLDPMIQYSRPRKSVKRIRES